MTLNRFRLPWFFMFALAVVPFSRSARATEPVRRFDLSWQASGGCPTGADVVHEVDELVANSATNSPIVALVVVESERDGFALTLVVHDAEGSHDRRLEAPTCDELGHAAALIVDLAIDPTLLTKQASVGGTNTAAAPTASAIDAQSKPVAKPLPPIATVALVASPTPSTATIAVPDPLFWRVGLMTFASFRTVPGVNLGAVCTAWESQRPI